MTELIKVAESQREGALVKKINSFTELRNYEPEIDKESVILLGGPSFGDINGGIFRYDSGSVLADDNNNTIVTVGGARWRRLNLAYATAAQGSKADSAIQPGANNSLLTNDSNFVNQAALDALPAQWQTDIGLGLVSNLTQSASAPTAGDDTTLGYSINSRWFDTVAEVEYVCLDATATLAVWEPVSRQGSPIGSIAVITAGTSNWTVPAGVYRVKYTITGGGGGGGGIGSGETDGTTGGNTTFNTTIIASGGVKGVVNSASTDGGAGGTASGGSVNIPGGGGGSGGSTAYSKAGGSSYWGGGGAGMAVSVNGSDADAYGAGGSGGAGTYTGGAGKGGIIMLEY